MIIPKSRQTPKRLAHCLLLIREIGQEVAAAIPPRINTTFKSYKYFEIKFLLLIIHCSYIVCISVYLQQESSGTSKSQTSTDRSASKLGSSTRLGSRRSGVVSGGLNSNGGSSDSEDLSEFHYIVKSLVRTKRTEVELNSRGECRAFIDLASLSSCFFFPKLKGAENHPCMTRLIVHTSEAWLHGAICHPHIKSLILVALRICLALVIKLYSIRYKKIIDNAQNSKIYYGASIRGPKFTRRLRINGIPLFT